MDDKKKNTPNKGGYQDRESDTKEGMRGMPNENPNRGGGSGGSRGDTKKSNDTTQKRNPQR